MLERLSELADANAPLLWWLFAASIALFLLTPPAVGYALIRIPADYFTARRRRPLATLDRYPTLRIVAIVAKNFMGVLLVAAGLTMLLMPGQGLLTIAVGLMLLNFPGKFHLERWLATRPTVWRSINWIRQRAGRTPLEAPDEQTTNN